MSKPINRATFFRQTGGVFAAAVLMPRGWMMDVRKASIEHPEPREGITGEMVLTAEALGKFADKEKTIQRYDAAREFPQLFDGVGCACSCGGSRKGEHRSLLTCFETMQPTGCGACQEEADVVAKAAREGKTLAEVRAAVDKWAR